MPLALVTVDPHGTFIASGVVPILLTAETGENASMPTVYSKHRFTQENFLMADKGQINLKGRQMLGPRISNICG